MARKDKSRQASEEQPKKRHVVRNVIIAVIIAVVVAVAAGGSGSGSSSSSSETSTTDAGSAAVTAEEQAQSADYEITDETLDTSGYYPTITGVFTNTSGDVFSYVGLSYNLYDADGSQIDNAYANTTNLADGASWKFEATSLADSEDVASYELVDVTAY